jgi:poly-gamma-glutamate synthesis protein (capsule biosynthesis protein)
MGIDVIVGGHPHVVQPVELLTSTTDEDQKTVCLYSMGNAVSNQRLGNLTAIATAHTEDGVLFNVTFCKYSDGSVYLQKVDLIPCWVNLHSGNGRSEYNILPLDDSTRDQWQTLYDLSDTTMLAAERSFTRTMQLVKAPLDECKEYLAQAKADREQYYLDLAGLG